MGARKEHRDAQASRRHFDRLAEEQRYARSYERALRESNQRLDEYEATVQRQANEIARLQGDVARLEAEKAGLAQALETERSRADRMAGWAGQMRDALASRVRAHQKLSGIVRLALTPEQYQRYHDEQETQTT